MGKVQYPQKIKDYSLFKDWLVKNDDISKGRCRFCKCDVNAKRFDLIQHSKTKKHITSSKDFSLSRTISNYVKPTSTKTATLKVHCSYILPLTVLYLVVITLESYVNLSSMIQKLVKEQKCIEVSAHI